MGPDQLGTYVGALKNALWPGGERRPPSEPRTEADKAATRDSASRKLSALMPGKPSRLLPARRLAYRSADANMHHQILRPT